MLPIFSSRVLKSGNCYFMRQLFLFICGALLSAAASSQAPPTQWIESRFNLWQQNNFQEKIYVHTDKAAYLTGEICWFKMYNVDGYNHQPAGLSKVAYVEMLDKNNRPVLQAKIALEKGFGDGSLYLPATMLTGNYKIRAYTNWMKNYGADCFFEKTVSIINPQKSAEESKYSGRELYDVGFFPEGGYLVNGLESKVGFKVNNRFGKGVPFEGLLLTNQGDTIAHFKPARFGMGSFIFTPWTGTQYKALIKLPDGQQQIVMLPVAKETGYNMRLERAAHGEIQIKVQTTEPANGYPVFLFVHTRYAVKKMLSSILEKGETDFSIPDSVLGDGISQLTVFNSAQQPVCERLYFKKPLQKIQITASTDQASVGIRKRIRVGVSSAKESGEAVSANMSMAVYKIDSLITTDECSISNYLLLSADVAGTIESPGYYFSDNEDIVAADNLMLTQGWRKFKWNQLAENKKQLFQFLPEVYGHIVTGKIVPSRAGLPVKEIAAYLTVPGLITQFQTAITDSIGNIKFDMKNLYSDGDIIVQTNNEKDSGYRFEIDTPFINTYSGKKLADLSHMDRNDAVLKRYISTQVQNAYVYNQLNRSSAKLPDTTAFYSRPNASYLLDNYVRFTTLEEVFREYVLEVNVRKPGGKFSLPVMNTGGQAYFLTQPLVLLDGLPVFNIDKIMSYDPLKIRKLDVLTSKYFLRDNSFTGIINLTTYKGDLDGFEIDPRATVINYEGLQLQREFYSPVYATSAQQQSRMPDFRSLLLWSPELKTDSKGKLQTTFYTSDVKGKYAIVIEGLSNDGRPGEQTIYFDVN
jgi:hypothetical protein